MNKVYQLDNVLQAARKRVSQVFDRHDHIYVSCSGGKDSVALFGLVHDEAEKRDRKFYLFFLDQEAEYQATIDIIRILNTYPRVIPLWYQVPIEMTNSSSYTQEMLYAWGEGEDWIRDKEPSSIHSINQDYPQRFYKFFEWFEEVQPDGSAFLVGLRAEEALNRFRAVTRNAGVDGIPWSTKTKNPESFKYYPIYDWGMGDVWKFTYDSQLPVNTVYQKQWMLGNGFYNTMRVSNLIHEKSFSCLADLHSIEPDTYFKLERRLEGVHLAANRVKDDHLYNAKKLPPRFDSWGKYRNYLLATMPISEERRQRFLSRWENQDKSEGVYQQQCKQLLINDWENNIPVTKKSKSKTRKDKFEKWRKIF